MTAAMAMPGNTAETFLVHFFGTGLADDRYVVERFRARCGRRHRSRSRRGARGEGPARGETQGGLAHGGRGDASRPRETDNSCRHVKRYKESKRERFLSPEATGRLGEVLA